MSSKSVGRVGPNEDGRSEARNVTRSFPFGFGIPMNLRMFRCLWFPKSSMFFSNVAGWQHLVGRQNEQLQTFKIDIGLF